jgi:hypothetical protein
VTATSAWVEGLRRVRRAPALVAGVWLVTVAVTVPPAVVLHDAVRDHLGSSVEADAAADGANWMWMEEFNASDEPLARTLRPDVIGFAPVLDNTSALADAAARPTVVVIAGSVFLLLLTFLSGGLIDRLARDRALHPHGFFAACGGLWFRMLRLSVVSAIIYAAVFGSLHPWLFDGVFRSLTQDTTVERTAFIVRGGLYVVLCAVIAACSMVFDYAKVRLVVEDRRSVLAAIAASVRFIRRHPGAAAGVYSMNVASVLVVLIIYAAIAPGAGAAGWPMWGAFVVSQAFIAARLAVKLTFWASEAALFQSRLAHAGFVRRPLARWPDPAAISA